MPLIRHLCLASTIALTSAVMAAARPPTLDPTYGLPAPKRSTAQSWVLNASWIWASNTKDNQTIFLRRDFDLKSIPKSASLYITADNAFTVYVDGTQASSSVDELQTINNWQNVHRVDIARLLTSGHNSICIQGFNSDGPAGVLAHVDLPGGTDVETDGRWKVSDAAVAPAGWTAASFDDSSWPAATVEAPAEGGPWVGPGLNGWPGYHTTAPYLVHLTLRDARFLDLHNGSGGISAALDVLTVTTPSTAADPVSVVVDFGREVAGRVSVKALTAGAVLVGTGESFIEATRSPWGGQHALTFAAGDSTATPYSAFRYAKLVFPPSTFAAKIVKVRIAVDDTYCPVEYKGTFDCSDSRLTKIWYTGAYTAHLCMQNDIWDAPKRDRAVWIGDLHVSGEVIDDVFADRFLMEHTIDASRPAHTNDDVNSIPGYSAAYVCRMADFYRHVGDLDYLRRHHEDLLDLLSYIKGGFGDDNLFENKHNHWVFTDWSPGFDKTSPASLACTGMFTIRAVRDGAYLLDELGDRQNAAFYRKWDDELIAAARGAYVARGTLGGRLQENAMAVYSGTATPAQYPAIFDGVLSLDSDAWDKTGKPPYNNGEISPYYGNYILTAMAMTGHTREAERLMRSYWGGMIDEGATTFWEVYDPRWPKKDFHTNLCAGGTFGTFISLCHGWSAGPTSLLTEYVLGVRPTGAGFKTVLISPDLGDLSWASGVAPTPHGPIALHVRKTSIGQRITVTLPAGVIATVREPGKTIIVGSRSSKSEIILSGPGTFYVDVR